MAQLILALAYSILNRLRGNATIPKIVAYALFSVLLCINAWMHGVNLDSTQYIILFLVGWATTYWGYAHCWGKYFPTTTDTSAQVCVRVVDAITNKIMGPYTSTTPTNQAINWKTVAMSFRYMIFFMVKYCCVPALMVTWAVYDTSYAIKAALFALFILSLAGPTYRLGFYISTLKPQWNQYNVAFSELIIGFEFFLIDSVVV